MKNNQIISLPEKEKLIEMNNLSILSKKIKQNDLIFQNLICRINVVNSDASEKLFSNSIISINQINCLP